MAAFQFIPYVTQTGDRLDTIAWKFYGDATMYAPIISANAGSGILTPVFGAGVALQIPVLAVDPSAASTADLPPWKRAS